MCAAALRWCKMSAASLVKLYMRKNELKLKPSEKKPFNLLALEANLISNRLAHSLAAFLRDALSNAKSGKTSRLRHDEPARVLGKRRVLQQVLWNLCCFTTAGVTRY